MTGGVELDGIEAWLQTGKPPHPNTWGCERGWTDRFRALRMLAKGLLGDDRKVVAALGISMPSYKRYVHGHIPRGEARRRDILRDLVRLVAREMGR